MPLDIFGKIKKALEKVPKEGEVYGGEVDPRIKPKPIPKPKGLPEPVKPKPIRKTISPSESALLQEKADDIIREIRRRK